MIRNFFFLSVTWLMAFNADFIVKGFAVIASVVTIVAGISTIIKNKRK